MRASSVAVITHRELQEAVRNRWFQTYTTGFLALSVGVGLLVQSNLRYGDPGGFGRSAAGLINLVLFLVPLMGLSLGAQSLASERERGTLAYLLSQPVSVAEVFIGKFFGLAAALSGAILIGFAASALVLSFGGEARGALAFAALAGLTTLLAWISLAVGCLISSRAHRAASALGLSVVVWLALAFLGDLGLIGTTIVLEIPAEALLVLAIINPLETYRIAAILAVQGTLDLLGPAGMVARHELGGALPLVLVAVLVTWLGLSLLAGYLRTVREEMQ